MGEFLEFHGELCIHIFSVWVMVRHNALDAHKNGVVVSFL